MSRSRTLLLGLFLGALVNPTFAEDEPAATPNVHDIADRFRGQVLEMPRDIITANPEVNASRQAYFGDLHVHTAYSFDAYAFGTLASPYDAYRYARGEAIPHPSGYEVKLREPLDFYAVTDHAMFLGAVMEAADPDSWFGQLEQNRSLNNLNAPENMNIESLPERLRAFGTFLANTLGSINSGEVDGSRVNQISQNAWSDIIAAAEEFNDPGAFTTFVGYEYTSSTNERGNLHRNVIFRGADRLPSMPFSRFHSQDPEGLWQWMDALRNSGIDSIAIPHNSNGSNGSMFELVDWQKDPIDSEYAQRRMRNEPLIELTQVKGTSETHPLLSTEDEWADFEIMPFRVATRMESKPNGSYAREALLNGLLLESQGVDNPYQFGFVGASDTHTGAISADEDNYFSKVGLIDGIAPLRGSVPLNEDQVALIVEAGRTSVTEVDGKPYNSGGYETWGASGLTGVWAESNTRDAIFDAFRRKETFATSGPRMKVRLFGGDFDEALLNQEDIIKQAYTQGVPMGAELLNDPNKAPKFLAMAMQDPESASLQRLQIIKGWLDDGEHKEMVYDVACANGAAVNPKTHRCPDNGATVDLSDCSISGSGAADLRALWTDPSYESGQKAFYYVRVLENPTCRWSTWDAVRAGVEPRSDLKTTIQERAWTSPIWLQYQN